MERRGWDRLHLRHRVIVFLLTLDDVQWRWGWFRLRHTAQWRGAGIFRDGWRILFQHPLVEGFVLLGRAFHQWGHFLFWFLEFVPARLVVCQIASEDFITVFLPQKKGTERDDIFPSTLPPSWLSCHDLPQDLCCLLGPVSGCHIESLFCNVVWLSLSILWMSAMAGHSDNHCKNVGAVLPTFPLEL